MTRERVGSGSPGGEVVLYEAANGEVALDVRLEDETVWLTRDQMATVFTSTTENIRQHLRNIFVDGELEESATTKAREVRRSPRYYTEPMSTEVHAALMSASGRVL